MAIGKWYWLWAESCYWLVHASVAYFYSCKFCKMTHKVTAGIDLSYTGLWMWLPLCCVPSHPRHMYYSLCCVSSCGLWTAATISVSCSWADIYSRYFLIAYLLLHYVTVMVSVSYDAWKPSMSWFLILVHAGFREQNLQVLASSLNDIAT